MSISISVVIPTHQRREQVARCVESALAQRYAADEVIVVDDGSTDGTADALAAFGDRILLVQLPRNAGAARARNAGIGVARNPWIALLDSDDLWLPDHLEWVTSHLEAHPDCRVVQTRERWFRRGRRVNARKHHRPMSGRIFEGSLALCLVSSSAAVLDRRLFDEVGGYDERLPVCEDYDLWLRMACRVPFGLIDVETVVKDGGRPDQLSRRYWGMDRFRVFALAKLLCEVDLEPGQAEAAASVGRDKLGILENGANKRGNRPAVAAYKRWAALLEAAVEVAVERRQAPAPAPAGRRSLAAWMEQLGWRTSDRSDDPILSALLRPVEAGPRAPRDAAGESEPSGGGPVAPGR